MKDVSTLSSKEIVALLEMDIASLRFSRQDILRILLKKLEEEGDHTDEIRKIISNINYTQWEKLGFSKGSYIT